MHTTINGTDIYYEIDGTGPLCFVLHGGLGLDHTVYRRSLGTLSNMLRLVFMDLRSNGRSAQAPLETVTMEQLADDVVGLADHLHTDDLLVLGHSYGGFVAQELATRHPARMQALLLVATRAGALGADEDPNDIPMSQRPAGLLELDAMPLPDSVTAAQFWDASAPYFTNPDCVETLRNLLSETHFQGPVRRRGSQIYAGWSAVDRLFTVSAPTLVIAGSNDSIAPPADSRRIVDHLPNATLVEINGANHWPWIETPAVFHEIVRHWLDEHGLGGRP